MGPSSLPAQQEPAKSFSDVEEPRLNTYAISKFLEHMKPMSLFDSIEKNSYTTRHKFRMWLERGGKLYTHKHYLLDVSKAGLSAWIKEVEELEKERGESKIDLTHDGEMFAYWEELIPLTEEEREQATNWLANNPPPSKDGPIKFRPIVPFDVHYLENE